jgi:membrane protease YdiL (CAAX protease family)
MYIPVAFKVEHDWWRYLLGVGVAIMGVFVFSLPHLIAIYVKGATEGVDMERMNDTAYLLSLFEPNLNLVFMLLPFVGGLIFLVVIAKMIHKQSLKLLTTARESIDWKRFWFAFIFWGLASTGLALLDIYMNPDDYVLNFNLVPFLVLCIIGILLIPLQTSFEEYLFRGYLMQGLGVIFKSRIAPLVITSTAFGLLHIANPEVEQLGYIVLVYYVGTGFLLGIMTLMDDGLELALGFHAANNLFTALLVTADWTAFQTHSIYKDISEPSTAGFIDVFMPVFILFPILLFIFAKKYGWTNWKQKLFGRVIPPQKEDYKIL